MGIEDYQAVKIAWNSGDLYLWRPKRLPLYQWENLKEVDSDDFKLNPIKEYKGIGSIRLQSWEAQLCLAAPGTTSLDQLLVNIKKSSAQIMGFLKRAVNMRILAVLPPG